MKGTYVALLTAALALAVAPAAPAADRPPAGDEAEVEEIFVYDTDEGGRRIGPRRKLTKAEREAHRAGPAEREAAAGSSGGRTTQSRGRRLASGCRGVDVARVGRSLFGFVTYKFWVHKDFCWAFPHVTGVHAYHYVTDVDPNFVWRGLISSWGSFYTWCCGTWNSGQVSFRQGRFENCILKFGCIRNEYPWVAVYGHGDGSWSYDTGL